MAAAKGISSTVSKSLKDDFIIPMLESRDGMTKEEARDAIMNLISKLSRRFYVDNESIDAIIRTLITADTVEFPLTVWAGN
jgi:hypothetical protein